MDKTYSYFLMFINVITDYKYIIEDVSTVHVFCENLLIRQYSFHSKLIQILHDKRTDVIVFVRYYDDIKK